MLFSPTFEMVIRFYVKPQKRGLKALHFMMDGSLLVWLHCGIILSKKFAENFGEFSYTCCLESPLGDEGFVFFLIFPLRRYYDMNFMVLDEQFQKKLVYLMIRKRCSGNQWTAITEFESLILPLPFRLSLCYNPTKGRCYPCIIPI